MLVSAKDEEWELERRQADDETDSDKPEVGDGVFKDVGSGRRTRK